MDSIIEALKSMDENDATKYIEMLFEGYKNRKHEGRLFENSTNIPKIIVLTYYTCVKKAPFYDIYDNFKNRYISDKNFKKRYLYNENKLENVHTKEEQIGLGLVYNYIQCKNDFEDISIYTLSDIHELLYSQTPCPEFGGKYRRDARYLPNSAIDVTPPEMIVHEMNLLRNDVSYLVEMGQKLGKNINPNELIDYIDKCIELNCNLIKIHPFGDGNGRSVRAFMNLLFKLANIPPVYIENREKDTYGKAMQAALGDEDLSYIKNFYYYKICDSIISLDNTFKNKKENSINKIK